MSDTRTSDVPSWQAFLAAAGRRYGSSPPADLQQVKHWFDPSLAYVVLTDMHARGDFQEVQAHRFEAAGGSVGWYVSAHTQPIVSSKSRRRVASDESTGMTGRVAVFCTNANVDVVPTELADAAVAVQFACISQLSESDLSQPVTVMVAFCDGAAIIYYTVREGLPEQAVASVNSSKEH
jgi:hypothetical protein